MNGKLAYLRERLNTSLWPIPAGVCLVSALLAVGMLWLDRHLASSGLHEVLLRLDAESAQRVLGIIAGSIIGVGGVAFSITMVSLTLTSGQYGPKVMRNFLEDNASKVTLGLFLGTYAYTLIALSGHGVIETPRFTVAVALILAFAALFGFVHFLHRTATDLQADQIVHRIGRQLRQTMQELADDAGDAQRSEDTLQWRRVTRSKMAFPVASDLQGYVQTIDYAGLKRWCGARHSTLVVHVRAGDFLIKGLHSFTLHTDSQGDAKETIEALNACMLVGPMRTPVQDAEYAISQLGQLAGRALSPGINDPGTAITCIDWFSLALAEIVDRDLPGWVFLDDDGEPRLLARTPGFAGLIKAVYAPLRQLSRSSVQVTVKLLESLCNLAELTRRRDRLDVLALHGRLIAEDADQGRLQDFDVQDIRQRHQRLQVLTRSHREPA